MPEKEVKKLEGISRIFNSTTINGRANVAKATYAAIALAFIYFRYIRRKPVQKDETPTETSLHRKCI
ncbi:putative 60S ribosomal protein L33 [Hermetia illucens]|uniref:putative 60S ribosomal protein L33 n=1 Tax=Hermetia illucens TaxID=343691 RepID=UPI0018CBF6B1|nr:putative 60S ribosomal protein L33 [Hermetia illucens]